MALKVTNNTILTPGHTLGEWLHANAFAVIKSDGSVVTWGQKYNGGDSSTVASKINGTIDVVQIYSAAFAFAALRKDGSVVTWGLSYDGGDSSAVASKINGTNDVVQIYSTQFAFAALRKDGSVVTWGDSIFGGDSSAVAKNLDGTIDVVQIYSTGAAMGNGSYESGAFAALRKDGSVVTWGRSNDGGDSSAVANQLDGINDVVQIYSTNSAFAALRKDGSVVTWGDSYWGGDSNAVAAQLNGTNDVVQVYSTIYAFAALRTDGSVITWGMWDGGGDSSAVAAQLDGTNDVVQIYSTGYAFAALRKDGSVVTWGGKYNEGYPDYGYGGDSSVVATQLNGLIDVVKIYSTGTAFAALRKDGSVVTWGWLYAGGDSSAVAAQLDGTIDVVQIYSTDQAFAALRKDGSVVTWGVGNKGGNSGEVADQLKSGVVSFANIYTDDVFTFVNHAPTGSVSFTGLATQGQTLTASNTLADAEGLGEVTYTWKTGTTILGTSNTYLLKSTDVSHTLTVTASYRDQAGTDESKISNASGVVGIVKTGTANADTLNGGNGDDRIDGGSGIDTMVGGLGNDVYVADVSGDIVSEASGGGTDTVYTLTTRTLAANVENLFLIGTTVINGTGNELANILSGNSANNLLSGGANNDTLIGGLGNDTLTGGTGQDVFRFNTSLTINVDKITDFAAVDDTIQLQNAIFTKLTKTGVLNAANLKIGSAAVDANDFIVYNPITGGLYYDADGNGAGAAVQVAVLGVTTHPVVTNVDFVVI